MLTSPLLSRGHVSFPWYRFPVAIATANDTATPALPLQALGGYFDAAKRASQVPISGGAGGAGAGGGVDSGIIYGLR